MSTQEDVVAMPAAVERTVVSNSHNYKEVSLNYREFRSKQLRLKPIRKDRLHCPMLDAARTDLAYGVMTLRDTSKKDLIDWANAIGSDNNLAFLIIAYLSGPLSDVPRNIWTGRFDQEKINTGFITAIKDSINTGIIAKGYFDQTVFDGLISDVHPHLKGKTLDEDCLYTEAFSESYLMESDLKQILSHNINNRLTGGLKKMLGTMVSKFEMSSLLLGLLSQPIVRKEDNPSSPVNAMLVRDLFDLYKYGWFPAHIEEGFLKAGLIQ